MTQDSQDPAPDRATTWTTRVGYIDTDRGQVAHHSAYVRWLEGARVEHLRDNGVDYRLLELEQKLALPVAEMRVRYRLPAFFDDLLRVQCWVGRASRATLRYDYAVNRGAENLATATVTLACVKLPEMKVCSMPEALLRLNPG